MSDLDTSTFGFPREMSDRDLVGSRDYVLPLPSGLSMDRPFGIVPCLLIWSLSIFASAIGVVGSIGQVDGHHTPLSIPLEGLPMLWRSCLILLLTAPWALACWSILRPKKSTWSTFDYVIIGIIFWVAAACFLLELHIRHASTSIVSVVATTFAGLCLPLTAVLVSVQSMMTLIALGGGAFWNWEPHIARSALIIVVALTLWTGFSEPTVRYVELHVPALPDIGDGYVICMLSDLHAGPITGSRNLRALARIVAGLECQVVVLNGDIAEGLVTERASEMEELLSLSAAPDGMYFVPGNHEYYNFERTGSGQAEAMAWTRWWSSNGVRSLNNTHVQVPKGVALFTLAGVDDILGFPDLQAALTGRANQAIPTILMAHRPTPHVYDAARHGVAVQVSGHTHGGQLWPAHIAVARANDGYISGLYTVGPTQLYVSDGTVSSYATRMRLLSYSEITVVVLRSSSGRAGTRTGSHLERIGVPLALAMFGLASFACVCCVAVAARRAQVNSFSHVQLRE